MEDSYRLEKILREKGLTEKQIKAGIKYYENFCKRHNINIAKSARMIIKMIENMRKYYESNL